MPLYEELCNYVDKEVCCTSSVPINCLERESEFTDARVAAAMQQSLSVEKSHDGYQIVYFQNSDKEDAFSLVNRNIRCI